MKNTKLQITIIAIIAVIVSIAAIAILQKQDTNTEPQIPRTDKLLASLPGDGLAFIRLNSFDATIGDLDEYLMGISPLPLGMMLKTQLAGFVNDPSFTTVDTTGNFAIYISTTEDFAGFDVMSQNPPSFAINMLVPLKADAPAGPLTQTMVNETYSLINLFQSPGMPNQLTDIKQRLQKSTLSQVISDAEYKNAASTQLWLYGNMDALSEPISKLMTTANEYFSSVTPDQEITPEVTEALREMISLYMNFISAILLDTEGFSLTANIDTQNLVITENLTTKKDSRFAKNLTNLKSTNSNSEAVKFINDSAMVGYILNFDPAIFQPLYSTILKMAAAAVPDMLTQEKTAEIGSLMTRWTENCAGQFAVSNSASSHDIIPNYTTFTKIKDSDQTRELLEQTIEMMNSAVKQFLPESQCTYAKNSEQYNDIEIDSFVLDLPIPQEEIDQNPAIEIMTNNQFKVAIIDGYMLITSGPDALEQIKAAIDNQNTSTTDNTKMAAAMENFTYSDSAYIVGYYDLLALTKYTIANMARVDQDNPAIAMFAGMLEGVEFKTNNSLTFAVNITDGNIFTETKLPKKYLLEIVEAFKQIKKNTMDMASTEQNL